MVGPRSTGGPNVTHTATINLPNLILVATVLYQYLA